jgi:hypothetical protein
MKLFHKKFFNQTENYSNDSQNIAPFNKTKINYFVNQFLIWALIFFVTFFIIKFAL